jgi:hypothetical protein
MRSRWPGGLTLPWSLRKFSFRRERISRLVCLSTYQPVDPHPPRRHGDPEPHPRISRLTAPRGTGRFPYPSHRRRLRQRKRFRPGMLRPRFRGVRCREIAADQPALAFWTAPHGPGASVDPDGERAVRHQGRTLPSHRKFRHRREPGSSNGTALTIGLPMESRRRPVVVVPGTHGGFWGVDGRALAFTGTVHSTSPRTFSKVLEAGPAEVHGLAWGPILVLVGPRGSLVRLTHPFGSAVHPSNPAMVEFTEACTRHHRPALLRFGRCPVSLPLGRRGSSSRATTADAVAAAMLPSWNVCRGGYLTRVIRRACWVPAPCRITV